MEEGEAASAGPAGPAGDAAAAAPPEQRATEGATAVKAIVPTPLPKAGIYYECSACKTRVQMRNNSPPLCPSCNNRVLFKMRTERLLMFEAR